MLKKSNYTPPIIYEEVFGEGNIICQSTLDAEVQTESIDNLETFDLW